MVKAIKKSLRFSLLVLLIVGGVLGVTFGIQAYPEVFNVTLRTEKNKNILLDEAIQIDFSQMVSVDSYKDKISITPTESFNLQWTNSNKTLVISPVKFWKPETDYAINLGDGRSKFFTKIGKYKLNFTTIKYPIVKNIAPASGSQDVSFDIEDPMTINFTESFKNFFIKIDFNPAIAITYQIDPGATQFKILPKEKILDGAKYNVIVSAKYIHDTDDGYRKIFTSNFETLPPAPATWDKDLSLRIEQSKKYTRAQIKEGKYIDINLAAQVMTIFEQGASLDAYIVSSGKPGMETPVGNYKIENKALRPFSKGYGLYMPNWMALVPSGKFGIHELPEWPGGYKEGANHLGTPISHGCVRLGVGAAKRVFDWAEIGTPVIVY